MSKELSWNAPTIRPITELEVDIYSTSKIRLTTDNGIVYWGMAGQSMINDIKDALNKAGIKAKVFRGHETSRRADEHDYLIVIETY